ncbi:MAG TPA: hypothetical protein VFJ59_11520 [Pseudolabrys sp.]|nr:hypothetical protein [Pseudolabrys sp.]
MIVLSWLAVRNRMIMIEKSTAFHPTQPYPLSAEIFLIEIKKPCCCQSATLAQRGATAEA